MASILQPISVQSPAAALGQSAGALGAYEQLQALRTDRAMKQQQAQQQAMKSELVEALTGRAFGGDAQALQQLVAVAPERAQQVGDIQQGLIGQQQAGLDIRQARLDIQQKGVDLKRSSLEAQDAQRQHALDMNRRARAIFERVKADPTNVNLYRNAVAAMESQGIIPQGTLDPETPPSESELAEFEQQLDLSEQLLSNAPEAEELKGELADIDKVYGLETKEGQKLAQRLVQGRLAEREARTAKATQEKKDTEAPQLPPGFQLMQGRMEPTKDEVKEVRKVASGIIPVISAIDNLARLTEEVGFEALRTDRAAEAQAAAALVQLQLKEGLALGALDADAVVYMNKLIPEDPSQFRQGVVKRAIKIVRSEMANRLKLQARVRGLDVDIPDAMGALGKGPAAGAITPNIELDIQKQLQRKGYSPRDIDKALSPYRSRKQSQSEPAPDMRSFVQERLDAGVDRQQIIRELQQMQQQSAPAQAPRREPEPQQMRQPSVPEKRGRLSPMTIPSIREQVSNMPAVRNVLEDPSLLSPQARKKVIRDGIEGRGIADAISSVLGGL